MKINYDELTIPKNYREGDDYNSISLVLPPYGSRTTRARNKFRHGVRYA